MASLITATNFDWPLVDGPCGPDGPDDATPDQWEAAQTAAIEWLWRLSGRQFGTWTVVFRPEWTTPVPVRRPPFVWSPDAPLLGVAGCGTLGPARPSTTPVAVIRLPGPVASVQSVQLAGATLDPSLWQDNGDLLYRVDGQTWPLSQDTTQPPNAPGSWQITYTRGREVPAGGQIAAGRLACELAYAMTGDDDCALPSNVVQVSRNGVTINMDDTERIAGFTQVGPVDQWIRSVNPSGVQGAPAVWTPDLDPNLLPGPTA